MRRDGFTRRAEFVLVAVPDGPAGAGTPRALTQWRPAVEQLIASYAANGWTVVAVRTETAPPQVLFRRPLHRWAA
jgi:hypothetical protein